MGDYTEIYINVELKNDTPHEVIDVLNAMCYFRSSDVLKDYPCRWRMLFNSCSYYTPDTHCAYFAFNKYNWCLLGKGDIKNYENEIEEFFEWIMPHVDAEEGDFIGYKRFEQSQMPELITKRWREGEGE